MDHIEWDLLSPLTPEEFAKGLCADIGLTGEAAPLIAHAIHEEILKHKRDAIEWGIIGVDVAPVSTPTQDDAASGEKRDRSGLGLVKDKTALGLGMNSWGRAPRDGLGRGPRPLKSVWKEWNDAEEYATRFEVLSAEEVERREIERERASRYVSEYSHKFCWRLLLMLFLTVAFVVRRQGFNIVQPGGGDERELANRRASNVLVVQSNSIDPHTLYYYFFVYNTIFANLVGDHAKKGFFRTSFLVALSEQLACQPECCRQVGVCTLTTTLKHLFLSLLPFLLELRKSCYD